MEPAGASVVDRQPRRPTVPYDPRAVLGLPPSATAREVRRAFRRLVLELHPDRNHGDPRHAARLRAVVEAYEAIVGGPPGDADMWGAPERPPAPRPPRARFRYACPSCDDSYEHDADCSRCDVALVDELEHGPARRVDDPRVDAMILEIAQRARLDAWAARHAPKVPAAAISSLLAGGAVALPIHLPIATMMLGYAVFLIGSEALGAP
jgi:hypothetical protein